MKFLLWMKQNGVGCDYTIACGEKAITFEANTMENARGKAKQEILSHTGDYRIEKATLSQLPEHLPVDSWYGRVEAVEAARKKKTLEDKEKAELARLQEKYN